MGVKITEKLEYTHKLVGKECYKEAEQEIEKLKYECCCELTATEIGYLCSALFNSPDQILIFITKQINNAQLKLVREQTLSLILEFIQQHSVSKLSLYDFQSIHNACLSLVRVEKVSKNKEKALLIERELVRSRAYAHELGDGDVSQLVNMLYEEIAKPKTKSTSTVQGLAIQLVGIITRYYPELIQHRWKRFLNGLFLTTLEKEMVKTSKSPDHKLIEGSLLALHSLLFAFVTPYDECDEDNTEDKDWCKQIYRFTRLSLECDVTAVRFQLPQAGLKVFTDHASKFGRLLLDDYRSTYRVLVRWSQHSNSKMKHHGWEATQSFLVLVTSAISSDESCPKHKRLFNFLAGELKQMLDGSEAGSKSEALAIRGYGYLAGPCRTYLDHAELMDIFKHMIRRCENIFLRDSTKRYDEGIHQLPSFIDSLANIALQIENSATAGQQQAGDRILSQTHLTSLEQLSVRVIDEYPRLPRHYANDVGNSLIALVSSFHQRLDRITRFLDCIVFQGLIRTCSRQPVTSSLPLARDDVTEAARDDVAGDSRTISHRSYIPLWRTLLGSQRTTGRISIGGSRRKLVAGAFANSLVKSLLKIVAKLNLKTKSLNNEEDEVVNPGMLENLEAENSEDFRIFVNLVQIITELLRPAKHEKGEYTKLFENHFQHLLVHLVQLSIRHPFVSGFYTLLGVVIRMAVRLDHFQQNQNSTLLLHRFVQKVVVFSGQFKGELLISVLIFFFQLPTHIADCMMNDLLPFIQRACHDSLSLPSLADNLLQALERWRGIFVENRPVLGRLLPSLQYLLSFNKDQDERGRLNERKQKKKRKRWNELEDPKWMKIRARVVRFMGRLGCTGDLAHLLGEEEDTKVGRVWDDDVTIEYELPLRDMKPVIKLEKLLPRVIHLACKSNHRKRKLSACELLHSITLFTIGTNAQERSFESSAVTSSSSSGGGAGFVRVYSHLFPALLNLASDVDSTCRQMFRPLVDQVIHWFTKNRNYENPETVALLNAIMDGLVDEHSATLRELCADSTREFLSWSIKQSGGDEKVTRRNGKSLLKRLINLCSQPSPSKRLGACLAFNRIYPIFREQESLVDEFTFELLVAYLQNLSLSTNDDVSEQECSHFRYVSTSCNQVISHLERIVRRRCDVLGRVTSRRRKPKGFASAPHLPAMLEWLFRQTSSTHAERRRKCMHLFCTFSALTATPGGWISERMRSSGGAGFIVSIYEEKLVTCDRGRGGNLLTFLLTALEGYSWLIQEKFVSPCAFMRNDWKLLHHLKHFIDDISGLTMEERTRLNDENDDVTLERSDVTTKRSCKPTPIEVSIYNERKCTVTSRTLQFFLLLLRHRDADDVIEMTSQGVWSSLVRLLVDATTSPATKLGYTTGTDGAVAGQLSTLVCDLIQVVMTSSLGSDLIGRLRAGLRSRLSELNLLDSIPRLMTSPLMRDDDGDEAFRLVDACRARLALRQYKLDAWLWARDDLEKDGVAILRKIYRTFDSSVLVNNYHDHSSVKLLIGAFLDQNSFVELAALMLDDASRGQNFLSYFSHEIYTSMCGGRMVREMRKITNISLQFICLLLCGLLDHLATSKETKRDEMCDEVLGCWDTLIVPRMWRSQQEEDRILVLDVLKKLVNIQPRVCHDKRHFAYESVGRFYLEILGDEKISLSFKNHALDLVRQFAPGHPVDMCPQLERFAAVHLSVRSRDLLPATSAPYVDYMAAVRILCDSFATCGHASILRILIYVACREEGNVACDVIQTSIQRASYKMKSKQVEVLEEVFGYFHQDNNKYSTSFRTRSVNLILLPLLESCDVINLTRFYVNHISDVMKSTLSEWVKYPEEKWEEELEVRSCSYQILDVMFKVFHRDQLSSSSQIGRSYSSSDTGKDESIIKSFLARANKDRAEMLRSGDTLETARRKFQCCLQNSLISALVCTQDNEKWFKTFIFSENPRKRIYFLDNLVDCSQVFEFQVELDQALERRKRFVAAKAFRTDEKKEPNSTVGINYIQSQTSAASSLEMELSAFDYNFNSQMSIMTSSSGNKDADVTQSSAAAVVTSTSGEGSYIELEVDKLNSHPCMPSMIALVKHLLHHKPPAAVDDDEVVVPSWMTCLREKLMTSSCHPNIRFFIVRMIVECSQLFKKYAGYWMGAIIQTITTDDWAKCGVDYFFCDVLVMLISWSGRDNCLQDSLQDRQMTGALVEKLIRHIHHDKKAVLRHNVTLLKTLLECWATSLVSFQINTAVTYKFFNSFDSDLKLKFTGLQVIGALLANQISPFSPQFNIDRDAYYSKIVSSMMDKHRNIYESASEVCGLLSNHTDEEIEEMVYGMLTSLRSREPKRQFVVCLNKVAQHHHQAVDRFVPHLVFMLNELHGELLTICLETLLIRAEKIEDLYSQLRSKKLLERLSTGDFPLQRAILRIYRSMMTSRPLTDEQIVYFLPEVARQFDAASCSDPECRQAAYDVMALAYQQQEERADSEVSKELRSVSKQFLIKSIDDPEDVIRTKALNFWNDERRLAVEPCGKLIGIFEEIYQSEIADEDRFAANLIALLLHSASLSPDFEAPVFKHKLAECQFQEYEIKKEWKNENETSIPLFVETIRSTIDMDSINNKQQTNNHNQVLATPKSLLFTPTVDGGKETFDWMTGTSLAGFASSSLSSDEGKSSLIGQPAMTSSKVLRHSSTDNSGVDVTYTRLRRRFVKDAREGAAAKFAKIHENKSRRETMLRKTESRRLEMDVKLHRKYREGELPDIQIPNKSIVAPLAGACQYDAKLSSVVMTTLVIAVIESASRHGQLQEKVARLRSSLNSIIGTSEEKNPNLMGAVLSIAYHSSISYMEISEVVTSSITSYQHSVGIMLLEKGLLEIQKKKEVEEEEPAKKKRRKPGDVMTSYQQTIDEQQLWIQLARLYKSLGDYDVTKGIFSAEPNRGHRVTKKGLTYESDEMYREAKKFYQQILQDESLADVPDVMREFWQDGCINATRNLARWKSVSECCDEKLNYYCDEDDVDMMTSWNYIDYQERYLPISLQSKVLVLLNNNNNSSNNNNKLQEFIDTSMKSPAHRAVIERKYSHHLATLFAYQNDMGSARHYLSSAIENLARHWTTLSPLMTSQRAEATRMIALLSDMSDFVDVMESKSGDDCSKVEQLICDWSRLMPHPLYDSIEVWSSLLTYRSFFADQLIDRHGNLASWINEQKCNMQMRLAKAAIKQKNFTTTARLLSEIKQNYADMTDETSMKFSQISASYCLSRARACLSKRDHKKTLEMLMESFDCLNDHEELLSTKIENKAAVKHMRIFAQILDVASQTSSGGGQMEQAMREMIGDDVTDKKDVERRCFRLHLKSLHVSDRLQLKSAQKGLLQLAQFCDRKLLEHKQEGDRSAKNDDDDVMMGEYAATMTKCVLRSMHTASSSSSRADDVIKLSFARLLQLCEKFGDRVSTIFIEQSRSVPSWMFLGWVGHLVALLDGDIAPSVHDVIWRLSRDYPQAVVYPLKAAMSGFQEKRGKVDSNRRFVQKLNEKLCREIPQIETFIREISHICNPVIQFQDWLDSFSKLTRSGANLRLRLESYQKMHGKLFGFYTGSSPTAPPHIGRLRWKFAMRFRASVDEMFGGEVGNKIAGIGGKDVAAWRQEVRVDDEKRKYKSGKLADYSPWLNEYQCHDVTMIEIPGQYSGRHRPDVGKHRMIIGFDDDVTIMESMRQPCKMTIRSSDEGKYPYLIKAGEDLRQDQRIETIFQVFNDIITNDVNLRGKKDFLISTYQVVPLNSKVGMIEWVNKTKTLSKIINQQARKLNCEGALNKAKTNYLPAELRECDIYTMYGEWAKSTSRGKNCDLFQQVLKSIPADILRRAYMQMSCDLESFVTLRKSFVTSYSVMCISNWLLGIGDRHLNNILVSMETGRVLGIDFGHAFGSATELLPVPEMTPFRLTRQIASMTSPHPVASGEMREVMRRCLKMFRSNKYQLEAIFDIFLHDPSVEWDSKHARKLREMEERQAEADVGDFRLTTSATAGAGEEISDRKWYAKRKMKIVKMKLEGAKSSFITKNEIEHNVSVMKRYGKYYIELVTGRNTASDETDLDEHQQVDGLIEQATDELILSRTYAGWCPWL